MGALENLVELSDYGSFVFAKAISPDSLISRKLLDPVAKLGDEHLPSNNRIGASRILNQYCASVVSG